MCFAIFILLNVFFGIILYEDYLSKGKDYVNRGD